MRINLLEALSDNITIDKEKCTFCGVCVNTCILDNLRMKLAPCRQKCPIKVNCQGYIQLIARGDNEAALEMVRRELPFPGIIGRVCSAPCEAACHRKIEEGEAVSIRLLKRYLTENMADSANIPVPLPDMAEKTGKSCAIVGAGPAGLMAAYDLARNGHAPTLMDAESEPGGMLRWGIPEFRLPVNVLENEIGVLQKMGVTFKGNTTLGREIKLDTLSGQFDAVIVATGCARPKVLEIPGEDADGVVHALPYLRAAGTGHMPKTGKQVVVIGGGDVALDAAQTALRLGAETVTVACLEGEEIMPASADILKMAEAEGIRVEGSWGPTRILLGNGRVSGVSFQRCTAVFDAFGRFAPQFDDCRLKDVAADMVIVAIGQVPDWEIFGGRAPEINPLSLQLGEQNIFVAGDVAGGSKTVIEAMASGREAAESVHRYMNGEHLTFGRSYPGPVECTFEIDTSTGNDQPGTPAAYRQFAGKGDFEEVETGFTDDEARKEAGRCYSCGQPFGKYRTCWFCLPCEVECPTDALWVEIPYLLR